MNIRPRIEFKFINNVQGLSKFWFHLGKIIAMERDTSKHS